MNKSEFLKRLAALLHILQEDEVRDILDEYEQHIDMKMADGMSEQDAISDFGSIEELAAEILSAYHVRPDFGSKKENRVLGKIQDNGKKVLDHTGSAVKSAGTKTGSFLKKGLEKGKRKNKRKGEEKSMTVAKAANGVGTGCIRFGKSCIDLMIRICFACIFLCAGFMEAGLILCAGTFFVLVVLGYPMLGISIAVSGAAMALFVIVYYAGKKMRRRA